MGQEKRLLFPIQIPTNYEQWVNNEKAEFDLKKYDQATLLENINSSLTYYLDAFDAKAARALGVEPWDFIVQQVNARPGAKILSLGSGPCGVEISLAKSFKVPHQFHLP